MPEAELPQLSDPLVLEMADRHHVPSESWSISGQLISLHCRECGIRWPCPTRKSVDAIKAEKRS